MTVYQSGTVFAYSVQMSGQESDSAFISEIPLNEAFFFSTHRLKFASNICRSWSEKKNCLTSCLTLPPIVSLHVLTSEALFLWFDFFFQLSKTQTVDFGAALCGAGRSLGCWHTPAPTLVVHIGASYKWKPRPQRRLCQLGRTEFQKESLGSAAFSERSFSTVRPKSTFQPTYGHHNAERREWGESLKDWISKNS